MKLKQILLFGGLLLGLLVAPVGAQDDPNADLPKAKTSKSKKRVTIAGVVDKSASSTEKLNPETFDHPAGLGLLEVKPDGVIRSLNLQQKGTGEARKGADLVQWLSAEAGADAGGGDPNNAQDLAQDLKEFERDLADLNAATARRRAELMRKMTEAKARHAAKLAEERLKAAKRANPGAYAAARHPLQKENTVPSWIIGVAIDDSPDAKDQKGIKVNRVLEGRPAQKAGLQDGDTILECNGIELRDRDALVSIIQAARDQPLMIKVRRRKTGEDGVVLSEGQIDVKVTPAKNEAAKTGQPAPVQPNLFRVHPDGDLHLQPWMSQQDYYRLWNPPQAKAMDPLRKDNAEIKKLLRELIDEVKKLKTD